MSAPRTKRQFAGAASDPAQRQITSFFASNGSSSPSTAISSSRISHATADLANSSSSLSESVQSNLLSVGMRVRKSVPEGYKTGTYSSFSLWDDSTAPQTATPDMGYTTSPRSRANAISTPRELLPFCGLNKVGGLGVQGGNNIHGSSRPSFSMGNMPTAAYHQPTINLNDLPLDDEIPSLSSSQETVSSTDSSSSNGLSLLTSSFPSAGSSQSTRKRFFIEDDDYKPDRPSQLAPGSFWMDEGDISPRSLVPVGWGNRGRAMAMPRKGGLRSKLTKAAGPAGAIEQENIMALDGSDFEEADFLDRERTWEVDMSDA